MNTLLRIISGLILSSHIIQVGFAEQITSACRISAIDDVNRTVTVVRKSATGEKTGVAKVAKTVEIKRGGKDIPLGSLRTPTEARIIYDSDRREIVSIVVLTKFIRLLKSIHVSQAQQGTTWGVAISPGGKAIAAAGDFGIAFWQADQTDQPPLVLSGGVGTAIAYFPDGETLATGDFSGKVTLWNVSATPPSVRKTFADFSSVVSGIAVSPDGRWLAAGGQKTGTVRVWDLRNPEHPQAARLEHDNGGFDSLQFSSDSTRLLVRVTYGVFVWRVSAERFLLDRKHASIASNAPAVACFSPDGSKIAFSDGELIRVVQAGDFSAIGILEGTKFDTRKAAFAPSGHLLVTAAKGHILHLWDTDSIQHLAEVPGTQAGLGIAFFPESNRFVTCGYPNSVKLWELADAADGPSSDIPK